MKVTIKRFADNGDTTLSVFYIDNKIICAGVEDEHRDVKVKGATRIPEGVYKVGLRNEGGYNERYKKKYHFHKGMLCIYNSKDWKIKAKGMEFQYILIHTGNNDEHTMGCYLPNFSLNFDTVTGSRSGDAYKLIYPLIANEIENCGDVELEIISV